MREFTVSSQDAGQTLIRYLGRVLPNAGSGFLYKMLRKKNIVLNDKKATGRECLSCDDSVKIYFSDETFDKFSGQSAADTFENDLFSQIADDDFLTSIIYEDDDIIAVDKPAGVLSQMDSSGELSMNEHILSYLLKSGAIAPDLSMTFKPSVANRLDKNTSGIILAGKTYAGQELLSRQLRDKDIEKYYYCICEGRLSGSEVLKGYIKKDPATNTSVVTQSETRGSKYAETQYETIFSSESISLLRVRLFTGRSHQIRAHLKSIGHPIAGDPKYAGAKSCRYFRERYGITHQLLHAAKIVLSDGRTFVSPVPECFVRVAHGEGIHEDIVLGG